MPQTVSTKDLPKGLEEHADYISEVLYNDGVIRHYSSFYVRYKGEDWKVTLSAREGAGSHVSRQFERAADGAFAKWHDEELHDLAVNHFENNHETNFVIGMLGKTYEVNITVYPAQQNADAWYGWDDEDWDIEIIEN